MAELTDTQREGLHALHAVPINRYWRDCPTCHGLHRIVQAIADEQVKAALTKAAEELDRQPSTIDGSYRAAGYSAEFAAWLRERAERGGA